jgi:hypothetical protein
MGNNMRIALIKQDGLISFVVEYENQADSQYVDGEYYHNGELLAKNLLDVITPVHQLVKTIHWDGTEFKTHLPQKDQYEVWDTTTFSYKLDEELFYKTKEMEVKQKRQQLLTATDWTDTFTASTRLSNFNEWQTYRQELRDITTQEGYPFNVEWPKI